MKLPIKITTGLIAGATLIAAASPAEAQYRRHWHRDRGGDRAALAIGVGIVGLAAGAALASSRYDRWDRGWRGRGWDRRWDGGYGWRGRYDPRWGGPRWGSGYRYGYNDYGYGYGYPPGYGSRWGGGVRCWRERVWDDWRGRWRRVRVCA